MEISRPSVYTLPDKDSFYRKKHISSISLIVGLLLFLLPFAEMKCMGIKLLSNTGIGIARGSEWQVLESRNRVSKKINEKMETKDGKNLLKDRPNIFLLVAMASAIFGIGMTYASQPWKYRAGMWSGIVCCVMMVAMMIQLRFEMKAGMNKIPDKDNELGAGFKNIVQLKFTIWYYLSLIGFALAAYFNYKKSTIEGIDQQEELEFDFQVGRGVNDE